MFLRKGSPVFLPGDVPLSHGLEFAALPGAQSTNILEIAALLGAQTQKS